MSDKLAEAKRDWYFEALEGLGGAAVTGDRVKQTVSYNAAIKSDESHVRTADAEELAHAATVALLHSPQYRYRLNAIGHEIHFAHGSQGSKADEVDVLITDEDDLPYAMIEIKAASEYASARDDAIQNQLFGTAPLVGSPKLLVYGTVVPKGRPKLRVECIDYVKHKSYQAWRNEGEPSSTAFPTEYQDLDYEPYVSGGGNDLDFESTQADFRAVALSFHNEFFGEHPDNTIFVN